MAERLHYFTEASTPVSFDCSDSDIDSDLDDLSRRPISEADRAKQHARQLQLWSDEARRRRSPAQAPALSPHRRPSSASMHDALPPSMAQPALSAPAAPPKLASPEMRARLSADRQQSNLSERARLPNSRRVSRSHSAKNLRIRITPSSSSKSLLSDIESELGQSASAPQSPRAAPLLDGKVMNDRTVLPPNPIPVTIGISDNKPKASAPGPSLGEGIARNEPAKAKLTLTAAPSPDPTKPNTKNTTADNGRPHLGRRLSFAVRGKRFPSLRRLLRR